MAPVCLGLCKLVLALRIVLRKPQQTSEADKAEVLYARYSQMC